MPNIYKLKTWQIFLSLGDFPIPMGPTGPPPAAKVREIKRGVVRAQVILATFYCNLKQIGFARRIRNKLDRQVFAI